MMLSKNDIPFRTPQSSGCPFCASLGFFLYLFPVFMAASFRCTSLPVKSLCADLRPSLPQNAPYYLAAEGTY